MFAGFNPFGIGFNPPMSPLTPGQPFGSGQQAPGLAYDPAAAYFQPQESFTPGAWGQTPLGATMTAFYRMKEMQRQHGLEQGQWLQNAAQNVDLKKDQVFEENHYQLDDKGQLVFDDKGNPLLMKGEEDADHKKARLAWEKVEDDRITADYNKKSTTVADQLRKLQAEQQTNPALLYDPKAREEYVQKFVALKNQSDLLDQTYFDDMANSGLSYLPDPDNPEGTMGGYIDKLGSDFGALRQRHSAEEASSPEGQLLAKLTQQYNDGLQLIYPPTVMV
jgi:hypothetical protein